MKRVIAIIIPLIFVATAVSLAQNQQPSADIVVGQRKPSPEGHGPRADTLVFVGTEMGFGGKVVKGAPYSAEAITETTQMLADGN
ncbi:MAG TPA: hypothetical protein VF251_14210, partial [Pyrinomonadaceae bacterium]